MGIVYTELERDDAGIKLGASKRKRAIWAVVKDGREKFLAASCPGCGSIMRLDAHVVEPDGNFTYDHNGCVICRHCCGHFWFTLMGFSTNWREA